MAKDKSKVVFYTDWGNIFNALPKEKAGELIQHLCKYINDENPPELPGLLNVVWIPMRDALKRDLRKYEAVCDKNKENIRKRWDKKDTTVYDRIPNDTKNTDKDKDIDKDNALSRLVKKFNSPDYALDKITKYWILLSESEKYYALQKSDEYILWEKSRGNGFFNLMYYLNDKKWEWDLTIQSKTNNFKQIKKEILL